MGEKKRNCSSSSNNKKKHNVEREGPKSRTRADATQSLIARKKASEVTQPTHLTWCNPTNNALLISFLLSSNAKVLLISTDWACKSAPKCAKTCTQCACVPTDLQVCMPPLVVGHDDKCFRNKKKYLCTGTSYNCYNNNNKKTCEF